MRWNKIIPEHEAEGELKETYPKMRQLNSGYG